MTVPGLVWRLAQDTVAGLPGAVLRLRGWLLAALVAIAGLWLAVDRQAPEFAFALPQGVRAGFALINEAGRTWWMLLLCAATGLYGLSAGRRHLLAAAVYVGFTVALAGLVTNALKVVFARARPWRLVEDGSFGFHWFDLARGWDSFPSGHATAIFALAFALGRLRPRLAPGLLVLALPVALARVVVTNHYPSDIVAGIAVAALVTEAAWGAFVSRGVLPNRPTGREGHE